MNILVFPASVRKIWIDSFKRVRNPSYYLLGLLTKRLSQSANVYVAGDSVELCGGLRRWRGEPIDKIIMLGADYTPFNTTIRYQNGLPTNGPFAKARPSSKQAYDIVADLLHNLRGNPRRYFLSVDVRGWEQAAEHVFGFAPDEIITEQEMHWQEIGYYTVRRLADKMHPEQTRSGFGFHGHMKARGNKGIAYFENLPIPVTIDGMGWEKYLKSPNTVCRGQQTFLDSARMMFSKKYSITMHEPQGNDVGWITARYFENIGFGVVNFVDFEYDKDERVIAKDNWRRVAGADDLRKKIEMLEHDEAAYWAILEQQQAEVNPLWMDFEKFYYQPFRKRLGL